MSCDKYDKYEEGLLTAGEFARHVRDCAECREQTARDARLEGEIMTMRGPVDADGLWERIEASLRREKEAEAATKEAERVSGASKRPGLGAFFFHRWALVPAGAALVLLVVLGLRLLRMPSAPSGLLAGEALARVESTEKEYLRAIESLERQAGPKLAAMDLQEMSLYKDKLSVINTQIVKCRVALDSNPGNAHIRRFLLAALQDKRQTLSDVFGSADQP